MHISDDGDIVRGLGFVTLYAAWVEEVVDNLLRILEPVEIFDAKKQRWNISSKLNTPQSLFVRWKVTS